MPIVPIVVPVPVPECPVPVPEVPVPVAQCPVPVVPSRVPVPIPVYGERATIASPAAAQKPDSWWCQMVPKMVPVPVPMPAVVPVPNPVYASANVPVPVPMCPCPCQCAPCQCQCARAIDGASASAEVVPIVCRKYCMVVRKQGTLSYQQTSDVCTCGICGAYSASRGAASLRINVSATLRRVRHVRMPRRLYR